MGAESLYRMMGQSVLPALYQGQQAPDFLNRMVQYGKSIGLGDPYQPMTPEDIARATRYGTNIVLSAGGIGGIEDVGSKPLRLVASQKAIPQESKIATDVLPSWAEQVDTTKPAEVWMSPWMENFLRKRAGRIAERVKPPLEAVPDVDNVQNALVKLYSSLGKKEQSIVDQAFESSDFATLLKVWNRLKPKGTE